MVKKLKSPPLLIGFGTIILTLAIFFAQGGLTSMNLLYVAGMVLGVGLISYGLLKELHKEQMLKKLIYIFFDVNDSYCYKYDIDDCKNTHEQYFRLGITNPNPHIAKDVEVTLMKCTKYDTNNQIEEITIAPSRLKPFGLNDGKGLFEIDASTTRYVNVAYMNIDFDSEISIPFAYYERGNTNPILLPSQGGKYKFELLVRGSNIKATKWVIYLEKPNKHWNINVKVNKL